jgi:hypothetical protein
MRISRILPVLVCSMPVFFAPVAVAQVSGAVIGGPGFSSPMDPSNKNLQPYTATWTQKRVQTLANGTTITHETTTRFARDSSGRTYMENHNTLPAGEDGQPREIVTYNVSDPVAHTTMFWNSNEKRVTVIHQQEPQTMDLRTMPQQSEAANARAENIIRTQPDVQREELGTKNIAGVNATGVRTTRTIPAGREGNDQPIVTTDEVWRSKAYGLILMSLRNDPRTGTNTREVTEFAPGEPDAALFHAPEGYTVHDIPARTVGIQ